MSERAQGLSSVGYSRSSKMDTMITILALAMVIGSLYFYKKNGIPALFYMGLGGLVALCGVTPRVFNIELDYIVALGLVVFGWGFARTLTVDGLLLNELKFPGPRKLYRIGTSSPREVTRRTALIGSLGLILIGVILLYFASRITSGYIFLLFGLELLVASFALLRD